MPPGQVETANQDVRPLYSGRSVFDIILGTVIFLVIAAGVYAAIRGAWRLHTGDVEEAGSDGRTFRR